MQRIVRKTFLSLFAGASLLAVLPVPAAQAAPDAQSESEITARAERLLAQMTVDEKIGQLSLPFYFSHYTPVAEQIQKSAASGQLGGVLFVTDPVEVNKLQRMAVEQSRLKIPLLVGFDVIHGLRTIFPVPIGMAASWDPALAERAQAAAAAEARAVGVNWAFAPNADIARDPRWGRIVETPGEDPVLASAMAAAHVRGFQGTNVAAPDRILAGPKHFAGYGAALGGRDYEEVDLSESQLHNVYLKPFKAAVDAGAGNIMAAYMALNGVPAVGNRKLLTDILRKDWGYRGFVVSDANAVASLITQGLAADETDAAVRAIKAGLNMEMYAPGVKPATPSLKQALDKGLLTQDELDDAVRPVLEAKIRLGLFEHPYVDAARAESVLNAPEHRALARVAAQRTAVLLKNEGALLPLKREDIKSVAVIGPLAESGRQVLGNWVFMQNKPRGVSILEGIRTKVGPAVKVVTSEGARLPARVNPSPFGALEGPQPELPPLDESAEIQRAVQLARESDVAVLVLGEGQDMSGEVASRASLDLPGRQQELLDAVVATGKPVVLVLMSARPLNLGDTKAAAILDVWYPGSEGGNATADLLFGDANPGGKLPYTWLRSAAQAPQTYSYLLPQDPDNAFKRYWDVSNEPTWPFGYGLSYTTFTYSNLKVAQPTIKPGQSVQVSFDLANTGVRIGDEVAQLYIHQRSGTSARPVRELKAFQRVTLKPGETRHLTFTLKPADLTYWSDAIGGWVQDAAAFDVWVGGNSRATMSSSFTVAAP